MTKGYKMNELRTRLTRRRVGLWLSMLILMVTIGHAQLYSGRSSLPPSSWSQGQGGLLGSAADGGFFGGTLAIGDFDGDGFGDLVISAVRETVGGFDQAGSVQVIYGSANGPDTSRQVVLSAAAPESNQQFGESLAVGDFNGDGFDDLAVGAPNAGLVEVFSGGAGGSSGPRQVWRHDNSSLEGSGPREERFGSALAAGDFDGDGRDDLAIGIVRKLSGRTVAGGVQVLYGTSLGLSSERNEAWNRDTPGVEGDGQDGPFGNALAAGDFDADGNVDLAVGVAFDSSIEFEGGSVHVFYGTSLGFKATSPHGNVGLDRDQIWHQNSPGVPGVVETHNRFGFALSTGDYDADGADDLVVGAPGEDIGSLASAGVVQVIEGGPQGLRVVRATQFNQFDLPNEVPEVDDQLGYALCTGDFDGDGYDDLAMTSLTESFGSFADVGTVHAVYGTASGLQVPEVAQRWSGGGSIGDTWFGFALAAGDLNGSGDDLVIGVPEAATERIEIRWGLIPPVADFTWSPDPVIAGEPVQFTDLTTGFADVWTWEFGTGNFAGSGRTPTYVFDQPGNYAVTLYASHPAGPGAITRTVEVIAAPTIEEISFQTTRVGGQEGDEVEVVVRKRGTEATQAEIVLLAANADVLIDYELLSSNVLSWPAGDESPRELRIRLLDDDVAESLESLRFELRASSGALAVEPRQATVLIVDDDVTVGAPTPVPGAMASEAVAVADDDSGRRAIAWVERGAEQRVVVAIIDAEGVERRRFPLASSLTGAQSAPALTWTAENRLVAVWRQDVIAPGSGLESGPGSGRVDSLGMAGATSILGRTLDLDDLEVSGPILLSSPEDPVPGDPSVSSDGSGQAVVTWDDDEDVRGRRVFGNGSPSPTPVGLGAGPGSSGVEVAALPTGEFVAVWVSRPTAGSPFAGSAGASSILGRVWEPNGAPRTPPITIANAPGAGSPAVDVDDAGNWVAVWEEDTPGPGRDVLARSFDAEGQPRGDVMAVSEDTSVELHSPRISVNGAGDWAVVWNELEADGDSAVRARFFADGRALGDVVTVADGRDAEVASADVSLGDDDRATIVVSRDGGASASLERLEVRPPLTSGSCDRESTTELCLQEGRFGLSASFREPSGTRGSGQAVPLSVDTGYFWFFGETNVEVVAKVIDGCAVNGHYWVFAGGLTDVAATLVVRDVASGLSRTYFNSQSTPFAPILDTSAFATCDSTGDLLRGGSTSFDSLHEPRSTLLADIVSAGVAPLCATSQTELCVAQERFSIEVDWRTSAGDMGAGRAVELTSDTGMFWFFSEANIEVIIKVLDGCDLNGSFWVFAGGLTDVGATIRVTDTLNGVSRRYTNALGTPFEPIQDTQAFNTCNASP